MQPGGVNLQYCKVKFSPRFQGKLKFDASNQFHPWNKLLLISHLYTSSDIPSIKSSGSEPNLSILETTLLFARQWYWINLTNRVSVSNLETILLLARQWYWINLTNRVSVSILETTLLLARQWYWINLTNRVSVSILETILLLARQWY